MVIITAITLITLSLIGYLWVSMKTYKRDFENWKQYAYELEKSLNSTKHKLMISNSKIRDLERHRTG